MDPARTLQDLIAAMQAGDVAAGRELASALRDWLALGGFGPPGHTAASIQCYLASVIRRIDETRPQPLFTLTCCDCDTGEDIGSEEAALMEGWSEVGPAFDLLQANFAGWCPTCKE